VRLIAADEIEGALTYPTLIDALADAFRGEIVVPVRHHHTIERSGTAATLLLMPAWSASGEKFLGCKLVTVFPDNARAGRPSLYGTYLLLSGETGEPLAVLDGRVLTAWRTAAASALAARHLAREDAEHLVMVGAGALAPHLVRAHASVRPINRVTLWNRTRTRAERLAAELRRTGRDITIAYDLEAAVHQADIVSCATLSAEPLVLGQWLPLGVHVDLVGGFTPQMREADDAVLERAAIYVDTRAGALSEAGDLTDPIRRGIIAPSDVRGDLFDLVRGGRFARERDEQITVFKSVGHALEDLATAALVAESASA
jgi:ornithine cyclodeaminase